MGDKAREAVIRELRQTPIIIVHFRVCDGGLECSRCWGAPFYNINNLQN